MPLQNASTAADRPTTADLDHHLTPAYTEVIGWRARLESLIERYPWPTLLVGLCLGYAISRRMR